MNITEEQLELLDELQQRLGYQFTDPTLLMEAVTHASGASNRLKSNERLEFLGDSILGFIVCEYLFDENESWLEGELTKIKSIIVSRQTCAELAEEFDLSDYLFVGKGVAASGDLPPSLMANALESIIAAIYIDSDMATVKNFLLPFISALVQDAIDGDLQVNYKSALQQLAQKDFGVAPSYKMIDQRGPDHNKSFLVAANIGRLSFEPAWGKNKKKAEQAAAANALAEIKADREKNR